MQVQPEELRTLEQKVDDARNVLTVTEQTHLRYLRMISADEYRIGELLAEKKDLEAQIEQVIETKDSLTSDVSKLSETKQGLVKDISESKTELDGVKKAITEQSELHATLDEEMQGKQEDLLKKVKTVLAREVDCDKREAIIDEKHESIRKLADALK